MRLFLNSALSLAVLALGLEAGAMVVLRQTGHTDPLGTVPGVLAAVGAPLVEKVDRLAGEGPLGERVHPYVGYMPDLAPVKHGPELTLGFEPAVFEAGSPLFSAAPEDLVVGVTGGSVAMFFALDGGTTRLAERLAAEPRFAGRRARFVALATGGMKQPQQLMWVTYLLSLGARLDVLVNLDGFNEVALHESENERFEVSPSYPRNWYQRVGLASSAPIQGQRMVLEERRAALARGLLASPLRRSHARQVVWLLQDQRAREAVDAVVARLARFRSQSDLDPVTQGPRRGCETVESRRTELVDGWRRASLQLHRLCSANAVEYYHFLQPNQYVPGSKPLSAREQREAYDPEHRYGREVASGYAALRTAAEGLAREGVRFHDLSQVFEATTVDLYTDDCCHFNRLGNELVADAMAEAILSWAPPSEGPR